MSSNTNFTVLRQAEGEVVSCITGTATLDEINAGKVILSAVPNRQIRVVGCYLAVDDSFATLTDVRISDTADTPVDAVTVVQSVLIDGATLCDASMGLTFTALTKEKGLQIRKTGDAGTGGTSITYRILYTLV
jgi:hypothetical protein